MGEFKVNDRTFRALDASYNDCETIFGMLMNGLMTLPAMASKDLKDIGKELERNPALFLGAFMNAIFGDVERRTQLIENLLQEHTGKKWKSVTRNQLDNSGTPESQIPPGAINELFKQLIESDDVKSFLSGRLAMAGSLGQNLNTSELN